MPKAIVVGSLNMDLVVMVDSHPRVGETVAATGLRYVPGGKGANQAIACRRLGAEVEMVGRIGEDAFGKELLAFQVAEGVDVRHVRAAPSQPSGLALVAVAADASNTIIVAAGANHAWEAHALDTVEFQEDDVLLTQLEIPTWVVEAALIKAGEGGAVRILNPSPIARFDRRLLPHTDVLILNELELVEAAGVSVPSTGDQDLAAAESRFGRSGCGTVITTLGAHGCRIWSNGEVACVDGIAADAIDTTGAGDCFAGVLAASLLEKRSLEDAARLANAAASMSVSRVGAAPAMPTREQLVALGVLQ